MLDLDEKSYFLQIIEKKYEKIFSLLEEGLNISENELCEQVFVKAKKLGFEKKSFYQINKENGRIFSNSNFRGIHFQLAEFRICRLALSKIIQENITTLEKSPKLLQLLDEEFCPYDRNLPNNTNNFNKSVDDLPEINENWLYSIPESLPTSLDLTQKYFTIFSWTKKRSRRSPYAQQFDAVSSAFVENETVENDPNILQTEFHELLYTTKSRSLTNFKNERIETSIFSTYPYRFLVIKNNEWLFNFDSQLVKPIDEFIEKYGLEWDESTLLDMKTQNKKIIKYVHWNNNYLDDSYTRERKADGILLEIDTKFLMKILKKENLSLLQIHYCHKTYNENYEIRDYKKTERKIIKN